MSSRVTKAPPKDVSQADYEALVESAYAFMSNLNKCIHNKENLDRPGVIRTPERFARAYLELSAGYNMQYDFTMFNIDEDAEYEMNGEANGKDKVVRELTGEDIDKWDRRKTLSLRAESETPVLVKDIPFNSVCEHHLLPFSGLVHVAYIPNKKILGLSKFPRNLLALSSRWQVQEKLTKRYCELIADKLDAKGVAVMIEATHSCMCIRGARTTGKTVTCHYTGDMNTSEKKLEFMRMIDIGSL